MVRAPSCDKLNLKRGLWTAEEDAKILAYVSKHGTSNWTAASKKAGLRRCGKSCRLRWTNYLRPDLKHNNFTPQEEELIIRLHAAIGSRWSIIAQQLPGRTDNDVKNYWNTKLRKKLSEMGIDPVTHKPFSQILADYGNIGGLPKTTRRIGSHLRTATMVKPDQYRDSTRGLFNGINAALSPTIALPETKPIQENMVNGSISQFNPSHSLDLLAQLQAMQLVPEASNCTNHETIQPHDYVEGSLPSMSSSSSSSPSSSSSSSSSKATITATTCSAAAKESSSIFSWQDFLLEEAVLPSEPQEHENISGFPLNHTTYQTQNGISNGEKGVEEMECWTKSNDIEASSAGDSTFIETLLQQDDNIFLDFLSLLEEPFYY